MTQNHPSQYAFSELFGPDIFKEPQSCFECGASVRQSEVSGHIGWHNSQLLE